MGDTGDVFNALREHGKRKRAANRDSSLKLLREAGYDPEVKGDGSHLILHVGEVRFDLWPGTGKWVEDLDHKRAWRGVIGLVERMEEVKAVTESNATTTRFSDAEFRVLLDWLMVSDPWVISDEANDLMVAMITNESIARGFTDWIGAYHYFEVTP